MNQDDVKRLMKEAIKEWLDERYAALGRWTLNALLALLFVGTIYFALWAHGWKKISNEGISQLTKEKVNERRISKR